MSPINIDIIRHELNNDVAPFAKACGVFEVYTITPYIIIHTCEFISIYILHSLRSTLDAFTHNHYKYVCVRVHINNYDIFDKVH